MEVFDLRSLLLFVHILAAVVLMGTSLFGPLVRGAARRAGSKRELLDWLDFEQRMTRGNPPAAMLLLGTGIYLGSLGWWDSAWFYVAVALFLASSALAIRGVEPVITSLKELTARLEGEALTPAVIELRASRRWELASDLLLVNDLASLYIMIAKPGLVASCTLVAALNLIPFALGRSLRLRWAALRREDQALAEAGVSAPRP